MFGGRDDDNSALWDVECGSLPNKVKVLPLVVCAQQRLSASDNQIFLQVTVWHANETPVFVSHKLTNHRGHNPGSQLQKEK